MKTLDVEHTLVRFQNLKMKDFKPAVLETYKRRFRQAVASFLAYVQDPGGWRPRTLDRPAPAERNNHDADRGPDMGTRPARHDTSQAGFVDYPFPLRDGQLVARLFLPLDLKMAEVKRLSAFMATLVVDFDPSAAA